MPKLALITGASSGIGRALAQLHARKGGDLIVTARSGDALETLKSEIEAEYQTNVTVVTADLAAEGGAMALYDAVKDRQIDILINNAGFGGHGDHIDRDLTKEQAMIDLNIKALVTLSHEIGRDMAARGKGRILNVGSTAGMMPGPLQAIYFATKAFVKSYSLALDEELRGKGVTVTVLMPGYVETGFADAADLNDVALTKSKGATPESVALKAYNAMMAGQLTVINDAMLGVVMNWIIPLLPHRAVLKMVRKMQTKSNG